MAETYVTKVNGNLIAASEVRPGSPLDTKLKNLISGAFEVVGLNGSGKPDVAKPSRKVIYLTKSETEGLTDPYTEWIYLGTDGETADPTKWEIIGTTSIDMSGYKTKQTAYTASGLGTLKTITSLSQDTNGVISASASDIQSATTSRKGVVQLAGSIGATVSSENNKGASEKAVRDAINALDVSSISNTAGKTIATISETDGKIAATFQNISITTTQVSDFPTEMTPSSHDHGYITNDGKITDASASVAISNGDSIMIVDSSDTSKIKTTSITFDGTTTTQFLSKAGTWQSSTSANDGKLKLQLNGGTATNKFSANQSTDVTLSIGSGTTNGTIKVDSTEIAVAGLGTAAYTASTDYATAAQGTNADSAIQGVKSNGTALTPDSNKVVDIPKATASVYGVVTVETEPI